MQNKQEAHLAKIKGTDAFSRLNFFHCLHKESVFLRTPLQGTWSTNWAEVSVCAVSLCALNANVTI